MQINVRKSCCMCIGQRYNVKCADILSGDGTPIMWVDSIRYLGIVIVRFCKFDCSLDNAKRYFFRSVNALFSNIGRLASEEVFLHLLNSKYMPVLLYSLEVCPLNKADIWSLDFTVTRCMMKLFRTCNTDIIGDCCMYFKFKLPSEIIPCKFQKFVNKLELQRCTLSCYNTVIVKVMCVCDML